MSEVTSQMWDQAIAEDVRWEAARFSAYPFNIIQSIALTIEDDEEGESIMKPITGYQLYLASKMSLNSAYGKQAQDFPHHVTDGPCNTRKCFCKETL